MEIPESARLPWAREALAVHEALRRMEYPSDAIFVAPRQGPTRKNLFVLLRFEGKQFAYDVGECLLSDVEFVKAWQAAVRWWNTTAKDDTPEHKKIWEESHVRRNSVAFVVAMVDAGFPSRSGLS